MQNENPELKTTLEKIIHDHRATILIGAKTIERRLELINWVVRAIPEPNPAFEPISFIIGDPDKKIFSHPEPHWVRRDGDSYFASVKASGRCNPEDIVMFEMPEEVWQVLWTFHEVGLTMIATLAMTGEEVENNVIDHMNKFVEELNKVAVNPFSISNLAPTIDNRPFLVLHGEPERYFSRLQIVNEKFEFVTDGICEIKK